LKRAINAAQTAQINDAQAEATRIASSSAGEQTFDMSETTYKTSHTAVRKARRFAMQGLYEWLVTDRRFDIDGKLGWKDNAPHDIAARTRATNAMHTVHIGYYHEMMRDIPEQIDALDALISQHLDREIDKLDTVEHAILLIGAYELQNRLEIPYKVVLDEAMKLNNHFGATDAHKLINAVLDKMAVELRVLAVDADSKANLRTSQKAATQSKTKQAEAQSANVEEASETTAESDLDSRSTASNKPRISANNASVKRNSASKALANIIDYKISKQNEAAKDVVVADPIVNEQLVEENPVAERTSADKVSDEGSNADSSADGNDASNENNSAADIALHDSNIVSADSEEAADSSSSDNTELNDTELDNTTSDNLDNIASADAKSKD